MTKAERQAEEYAAESAERLQGSDRLRRIEMLGGPWHGSRLNMKDGVSSITVFDGLYAHTYERGEFVEGTKVREVMRWVAKSPTPMR